MRKDADRMALVQISVIRADVMPMHAVRTIGDRVAQKAAVRKGVVLMRETILAVLVPANVAMGLAGSLGHRRAMADRASRAENADRQKTIVVMDRRHRRAMMVDDRRRMTIAAVMIVAAKLRVRSIRLQRNDG
jgi:hypothetical protein